ncbi:SEC23-interacting protein isoform X2 [Procambarus clarkii]|uniref:SEC23-interacting protein isoform X2 n=1 Tax=Procambarus clarkii TaxID=6728 RepID=UPI0037437F29
MVAVVMMAVMTSRPATKMAGVNPLLVSASGGASLHGLQQAPALLVPPSSGHEVGADSRVEQSGSVSPVQDVAAVVNTSTAGSRFQASSTGEYRVAGGVYSPVPVTPYGPAQSASMQSVVAPSGVHPQATAPSPLVLSPTISSGEAFKAQFTTAGSQSVGSSASLSFSSSPHPHQFLSGKRANSLYYTPVGPPPSTTLPVDPLPSTTLPVDPPPSMTLPVDPPPSTTPPVGLPPSATPPVGPPSATPSVGPPPSATPSVGPPPSATPPVGPPSATPSVGPPPSATPPVGPPSATPSVGPPPSATPVDPPPSATPSVGPPPSATPPVGPPSSAAPVGPPPSAAPVGPLPSAATPVGPPSSAASPVGPPPSAASPVGPPPSTTPVGPPPSTTSLFGPPSSTTSLFGQPPSSTSSFGPPPSSISSFGPPPSATSSFGPPPSATSSFGPPPSATSSFDPPPSATSSFGPPPSVITAAATFPNGTLLQGSSTADRVGALSNPATRQFGPPAVGHIPLGPPPVAPRTVSPSLGPPPVGLTPADLGLGAKHKKASSLATGLSSISLERKLSEAALEQSTSGPPRTSFTPDHSSVIPPSFENMAGNPAMSGSVYHPVIHHWFYAVGRKQVWRPFSFSDSFNLEEAYLQESAELVPTEGGRYDVSVKERTRKAVYWEQDEPSHIRRCSWFKKSPLDAQPLPYDEEVAEQLEREYQDAVTSGQWHRQIDLKGGDRIMIHSPRAMIHYIGAGEEGEFPTGVSVHASQAPLTVKRGTEDFEIDDGEAENVDHLVFLIHGIGSVCDLRFRPVEECVDDFRRLGQKLLSSHFKQSVDMGVVGRVEILPISWHKALHGDATGIDEKLKPITLRSIPKLREFTNDTIMDVLLFNSPIYCQHIMDTVASELNRLHALFCQRNPSFSGLVSLGGHSLGSVILFDLLMHQSPELNEAFHSTLSSPQDDHDDCKRENRSSVTSPVDYIMGGAGTGQPSIVYPHISFKPEAFFLMGSPIAMFITVRGIETIGPDFELPTCKRVFNIFHPFDPVAYRLETLIDPSLIEVRPVLVPHHKGRKRMHLELKETIERVGTEFKQKIVDSIQSTWNRLYQFYSGGPSRSLEQHVDEALADRLYLEEEDGPAGSSGGGELKISVGHLNGGKRIDYVLQEKPYESFNEYIFALQAHVTYWESEDTMLLILKELYEPQGILSDVEINSKPSPSAGQTVPDGDPGRGSASHSPSNPRASCASNVVQAPNHSSESVPLLSPGAASPSVLLPPTEPVPLLSMTTLTSTQPPVVLPSNTSHMGPRVIGGRPVMDISSQQTLGMDPTVRPMNRPVVGPPPKVPGGTFVRVAPFRR